MNYRVADKLWTNVILPDHYIKYYIGSTAQNRLDAMRHFCDISEKFIIPNKNPIPEVYPNMDISEIVESWPCVNPPFEELLIEEENYTRNTLLFWTCSSLTQDTIKSTPRLTKTAEFDISEYPELEAEGKGNTVFLGLGALNREHNELLYPIVASYFPLTKKGRLMLVKDKNRPDFMGLFSNILALSAISTTRNIPVEELMADIICQSMRIFHYFALLNCRNHITRPVKMQKELKDKFYKVYKQKPALTTYKTVEIDTSTGIIKKDSKAKTEQLAEDLPKHSRRGHLADYRENGLFGKWKGIFWFPGNQEAGNESKGKIVKTYKIK